MNESGIQVIEPAAAVLSEYDLSLEISTALRTARFKSGGDLTIIVNDPQRQTASRAVIEEIFNRKHPPSSVKIVIATGTHRFDDDEKRKFEINLTFGLQAIDEVIWHDCESVDLQKIGQWRGHPFLLDGLPILAIGSSEPHYFSGFSGVHKTCTIGLAGRDDIERNHSNAMSPDARPGKTIGNPVFEGICSMYKSLAETRPVGAVNLVQDGSEIIFAAGGDAITATRKSFSTVEKYFLHKIPAPADAIICEVAGPLGETFYQADKGIKNNEWAIRDGGVLILLAPCSRGVGQDHFVQLLRESQTHEQAEKIVAGRGYHLGDHKAVKLRYLTDKSRRAVRVIIVSDGLTDEQAKLLGAIKSDSVADAMKLADISAERDKIYHVKDAGNISVTIG